MCVLNGIKLYSSMFICDKQRLIVCILYFDTECVLCQEKVYQEVFRIFGDSDRDVTVDDLNKMEYTEMVIKETLRMYPIVPIFLRIVKDDLDLSKYRCIVQSLPVIV